MTGFELAVACLALNIYHEAAFEPQEGKLAVAFVTINRARERRLDVCDAVFEPMQFSWANNALDEKGKLLPQFIPKGRKWQEAREVAKQVLGSEVADFTQGADHYHAEYIAKPKWAKTMVPAGKYGKHFFYRQF